MTAKRDLKRRIRARQAKTGESYTSARAQVLRARDGDPEGEAQDLRSDRVIGVVLKCGDTSMRVRLRGEEEAVTLRCSGYDALRIAPAQWIEVELRRRWRWRGDPYASGQIVRAWTDVEALGLVPLPLEEHGEWDLSEIHDPFEAPDPYAPMWSFFASTPREAYELNGIAWGAGIGTDPDADWTSRVAEASELARYDREGARELLMELLLEEPRCIDAHVALGNMAFDSTPDWALTHYELAVKIGELSLGSGFAGLLPWSCLYNRPLLRALHGYGLCLWRLDRPREAREVFERLLSLNPADHQGVRFCWEEVRQGRPWRPDEAVIRHASGGMHH